MCGIAGIIDPKTSPADRLADVERMCAAMAYRGPDDRGSINLGEASLGMRRLAVFDPANGHQPMQTPDGRFTLIFNGAIINFRELRSELAGSWSFRTGCDTEVLLAAFAAWGEKCLKRLRGMFAFAVWDTTERSLFLARDPFGIKPLYFRQEGTRLCFASEIHGLRALAGELAVDPLAVGEYLGWLAVPAPRTLYRGVFSLRPGERALFRHGQLDLAPFWTFGSIPPAAAPCGSRADFTRELRARLDETVRAHAVADVPVGAFLSGGLDSAVVAALMTRATGDRLRTFTIGFSETDFSEAGSAAETARYLGADHHTHILTGAEVAANVDNFIAACDQPTGDGLNTYFVSRLAHQGGVKVALSGLGGDELFGGYPSFQNLPRLAAWLPWWRKLPRRLRDPLVGRLRRGDVRQRKLADFLRYARDTHELASMQRRVFSEARSRSLLATAVTDALPDQSPFHPELFRLRTELADDGAFEIASAWELRTYMADLLLRDSDVMSMRHSLELRVPFVDRPFVEWLWGQSAAFKFTSRQPKDLMAAAVADLLPPQLRGQSKRGFALPMDQWMRRDLRPFLEETFSNASVERSGLFSRPAIQSFWQGFLTNDDSREWSRVWSLAVLIACVNRRPTVSPDAAAPAAVTVRPAAAAAPPRAYRATPTGATLLMTPEIFSSVGGIPRILQVYLKALCDLASLDHSRVRLLSLNDPALDSTDLRRYTDGGLDDWYVCNRRKGRFLRHAFRMSRGCDRLVCGHVAQLPVAWLVRLRRPKLRYYVVAHGIDVWRRFSLIERLALRGAERVFCVSAFTRGELLRNCRLRPEKVVVLPNALDPYFEIQAGRPLAECGPTILAVSRLTYGDRYKGVEHLIPAMAAVRAAIPQARLRIIGQGDDLRRLQGIARKAGLLSEAVEFLGYVDDQKLKEELANCRLLALPSEHEGFGLVFIEAMAQGRPCLGARSGGTPEVITPETGILVEFGNVSAIAAGCIAGLQRDWNQAAILERARYFSYASFKDRIAAILPVRPSSRA